jgi:hypothetical protein
MLLPSVNMRNRLGIPQTSKSSRTMATTINFTRTIKIGGKRIRRLEVRATTITQTPVAIINQRTRAKAEKILTEKRQITLSLSIKIVGSRLSTQLIGRMLGIVTRLLTHKTTKTPINLPVLQYYWRRFYLGCFSVE